MKRLRIPFLYNNQAVSHAISAVIVSATIITLVLVASMYAYQVLEQQRAMTEFECVKESILAFNDALENVAWKSNAVRSARFTIKYGNLELMPNVALAIEAYVDSQLKFRNESLTGFIRYCVKNAYVNFGDGYKSYILGDNSSIIFNSVESYGKALIEQASSWVNITLSHRVRAMRTSVIVVNEQKVNYVEIWIIKVISNRSVYIHDFDLKARCLGVKTISYGPYDAIGNCTVNVLLGSESSSGFISLDAGKVVFNVVTTETQVTV